MKKQLLVLVPVLILGLAGCGSSGGEEKGYSKDDFKKSGPPPQYKGPGQAGAPGGAAPASGPAGMPPGGPPNNGTGGGATPGATG